MYVRSYSTVYFVRVNLSFSFVIYYIYNACKHTYMYTHAYIRTYIHTYVHTVSATVKLDVIFKCHSPLYYMLVYIHTVCTFFYCCCYYCMYIFLYSMYVCMDILLYCCMYGSDQLCEIGGRVYKRSPQQFEEVLPYGYRRCNFYQ